MKTPVRKIVLALALGLALVPMISIAQDAPPAGAKRPPGGGGPGGGGGHRMNPEQQVQRLDEMVTLTAEQRTKITEIFKKQGEAVQAIPQEERREKGQALRKATHDEIRALLTPEQQKKFDAMPAPGRGGPGGPGGPRGDASKKE